jgi:hypothetical protein
VNGVQKAAVVAVFAGYAAVVAGVVVFFAEGASRSLAAWSSRYRALMTEGIVE